MLNLPKVAQNLSAVGLDHGGVSRVHPTMLAARRDVSS